jgi:hypothetical protein
MRQAKGSMTTPAMVPIIAVVSVVVESVVSAAAIAIGIGIGLGRPTGLGPFLLEGFDGASRSEEFTTDALAIPSRRAWKTLGLAAAIGVLLAANTFGVSYAFDSMITATEFEQPALLEGLLASFGAGIREEVWLRLGLMTLLAWLGAAITRCEPGNSVAIWSANVLAALAFGAMHLPQAAMLYGLDAALVAFVFIGNGVPGIAFGWLFWRKGLIAAMVAHFSFDVVLKVIYPAIAG